MVCPRRSIVGEWIGTSSPVVVLGTIVLCIAAIILERIAASLVRDGRHGRPCIDDAVVGKPALAFPIVMRDECRRESCRCGVRNCSRAGNRFASHWRRCRCPRSIALLVHRTRLREPPVATRSSVRLARLAQLGYRRQTRMARPSTTSAIRTVCVEQSRRHARRSVTGTVPRAVAADTASARRTAPGVWTLLRAMVVKHAGLCDVCTFLIPSRMMWVGTGAIHISVQRHAMLLHGAVVESKSWDESWRRRAFSAGDVLLAAPALMAQTA